MRFFVAFFSLSMVLLSAQAQPQVSALRDPTRPPDWQGSVDDEPSNAALRLEAVKRIRQGRASATINGTQLHVGQEIRGLRLISIAEEVVVLEGPEGRQELRLAPTVERPLRGKGSAGVK